MAFTASVNDGIAEFVFNGDLVIDPLQIVEGTGSNAVRLAALNDAEIGEYVSFRFSGDGRWGGPGGGDGGGGAIMEAYFRNEARQARGVTVGRGEIRRGTISIIIMAPKTENQANWAYLEGTERLVRQVTTGSMV